MSFKHEDLAIRGVTSTFACSLSTECVLLSSCHCFNDVLEPERVRGIVGSETHAVDVSLQRSASHQELGPWAQFHSPMTPACLSALNLSEG